MRTTTRRSKWIQDSIRFLTSESKPKSSREKFLALIRDAGLERVPYNTSKYVVFRWPFAEEKLLFVGKAGALRVGRVVTISISLSPAFVTKRLESLIVEKGFQNG